MYSLEYGTFTAVRFSGGKRGLPMGMYNRTDEDLRRVKDELPHALREHINEAVLRVLQTGRAPSIIPIPPLPMQQRLF